MSRLVVFDLDGTLLAADCEVVLLRRLVARGVVSRRTRAAIVLGYLRYRFAPADALAGLKQAILERLVAGRPVAEIEALAATAAEEELLARLVPDGLQALATHRSAGDRIVLLSAAVDLIVEPIAAALGIDEVICTRLVRAAGRFTGETVGPVPIGSGKVAALHALCARHGTDLRDTVAYADHLSDRQMLERVGTPIVVNPSRRLALLARAKDWRIERWAKPLPAALHARRA